MARIRAKKYSMHLKIKVLLEAWIRNVAESPSTGEKANDEQL